MYGGQGQYRRGGGAPPQNGRQIVLPEPGDIGQMILRGSSAFARRHKVVTGGYLFGILVIILIGSGAKLNYDQRKYNKIMNTINFQAENDASYDFWRADQAYRATKGWFSCDGVCQRNKRRMETARHRLDEIRKEGNSIHSDAKAVAGLFSEVGVGEVQDSFWSYFSHGKEFAKRQSMWDAMFAGIRAMRRDESMIEYGLNILMVSPNCISSCTQQMIHSHYNRLVVFRCENIPASTCELFYRTRHGIVLVRSRTLVNC